MRKILAWVIVGLSILCVYDGERKWIGASDYKYLENYYGAEFNPTGDPIGGGKGYRDIKTTGDFIVKTKTELMNALSLAKSGDVIFIPGNVTIDLNNVYRIEIPGGVTLASDRGHNGSLGALLFNHGKGSGDERTNRWQFVTKGSHVRITGIRIEGPDPSIKVAYEPGVYLFNAILSLHDHVEVDNCEIFAWNGRGIFITGRYREVKNAYIHHNFFHHIRVSGQGYPVDTNMATVYVIGNRFEHYRHAVASTGRPGSNYQVAWNIFGAGATHTILDAHGDPDGSGYAGGWVIVHHNTFLITEADHKYISAHYIRDPMLIGAEFFNNKIYHDYHWLSDGQDVIEYTLRPVRVSGQRVYNNYDATLDFYHAPYEIIDQQIVYTDPFTDKLIPELNPCGPRGGALSLQAPTNLRVSE